MPWSNHRDVPTVWIRAFIGIAAIVPLALAVLAAASTLATLYASVAHGAAQSSRGKTTGLEAAQLALRLAPWRASIHAILAQSWSADGRLDRAITHTREAIRGKPGDGYMWQYLARLESARGDPHGEALALYKMALKRTANAPPLHRAIAIDGVRYWRFGDMELRQLWHDSMRYSLQHERKRFLKEVASLGRDPHWCATHQETLPIAQWCARAARIRLTCAQENLPEQIRRRCRGIGLRGIDP